MGLRVLRLMLRLLPAGFRSRHGRDLLECHEDAWATEAAGKGRGETLRFWARTYGATAALIGGQWMAVVRRRSRTTREAGMGWDGWRQDCVVAVRGLTRRPGFSLVVILTLGLGMGANVAVFSVLHSVVFAPLPYEVTTGLVPLFVPPYLLLPFVLFPAWKLIRGERERRAKLRAVIAQIRIVEERLRGG